MEAAVYPDWSGLPEDLMIMVMRGLDIPDLFCAGTVCAPWYAACSAVRRVRIPITDASPCLLYSCAADDPDTATIYSPSSGASFKVRLPAPSFRSRHVVGAGHGWVVTADEASNLQAVNPLTGAQVDLPPATGLHHVQAASDEEGRPVYIVYNEVHPDTPAVYAARELRLYLYNRACLSCSPSAGRGCVVLLLHQDEGEMSYARLGDDRWTLITQNETVPWKFGYRTAAYNEKDGLFYVLTHQCSIYTLDLNGPSPIARKITQKATLFYDRNSCIVFAPWGDILHVYRLALLRTLASSVQVPAEWAQDVIDPRLESYTDGMELYKVDIDCEKLVKMSSLDLQGHALFLGFNSMLLSTKDFPRLKPNCAYLTDDNWEQIGSINIYCCREIGMWNFEKEALESLADLHSSVPLNWPPPIWITPSLC
ncbi:hypothetical protein BAE44_0022814 [Dichanthelium oligosanthes]|uniref:Uncharacterized protein n=1 Tax=Dichanthelium oligosanthes TaxID=888268 RepID=A0A1E5UTN9_9POAL|nr:hypothetical protein BAE44_0022814 [Dichanthelium oligosanthes]